MPILFKGSQIDTGLLEKIFSIICKLQNIQEKKHTLKNLSC